MRLLLITPALVAFSAIAQNLPDISFKEGLWESSVTTMMQPAGMVAPAYASSQCHTHANDATEMSRSFAQGCRILSSSQDDSGWQLETACTNSGVSYAMKMSGTVKDEEHLVITSDVKYTQGMPGGITGVSSTTALTYKGPCPANLKPGDTLLGMANGRATVIHKPTAQERENQEHALRQLNASGSLRSSMTMAQSTSPALSQRPTPYSTAHPTGPPISNADVLALAAAGLDDDVILAKINAASTTTFDTSIDGLKALKAGGVSNSVIKIMVGKVTVAEAEAAASSDDPNVMHQPGVYALISGRDGQVHLLQLEHTHAAGENMSGNTLAMAYLHTKRHTRESLNNPTSPIKIEDRNPTFYIYIPQDTQSFGGNDLSARDFELLRLRVKSRTREVETSSTSITGMGASGIEDKARQPTNAQKVKPGIYMVKVSTPLKPGEYAFQHELEGVFYDFTIAESR